MNEPQRGESAVSLGWAVAGRFALARPLVQPRRLAWSLWALSLALTGLGLLLLALSHNTPLAPRWLPPGFVVGLAIPFSMIGALITSRQPRNRIGWLFSWAGLISGVQMFTDGYAIYSLLAQPGSLPAGEVMAWLQAWLQFLGGGPVLTFLFLLFPDGRLLSPRWRLVAALAAGSIAALAFGAAFRPGRLLGFPEVVNPFGIEEAGDVLNLSLNAALTLLIMSIFASAASLLLRFRRAQGDERQQLKWFAYAAGLAVATTVATFTLPTVGVLPVLAAMLGISAAVGIAILRHRLYDIDLLINRTLVYGALTAIIVGLYVLVVGALSTLFQTSGNLLISLLATGLAALLFQPLRERLQRVVNHLMYGQRDEPYAVLSRLGQRLETTLAPEAVLPTVVETVAQALKLPYAAITLKQEDRSEIAAAYGRPTQDVLHLPLVYQTETVGELLLAPRAPREAFSQADQRLLSDLARQAGVAAHAVHLTTELQRSRERLVMAREEERRRLRRDLHDGLGPALASLTLKLDAVRNLIWRDPAATDALLVELKTQTQAAIADIRRLVYDLRPPALDELGLVSAIREYVTRQQSPNGLDIIVQAPERLPPLPAAVEVAAYRIALEALTNVARHAHAHRCVIRLSLDGALQVEISDDGIGLPADCRAGVGLTSMRERAAELGGTCVIGAAPSGGTHILARLPLPASEE